MRRFVLLTLLAAPVSRATAQLVVTTGVPVNIGTRVFFGAGAEINLANFIGQTFVVPAGLTSISEFAFGALPGPVGANSNFSYTGSLQAWDPVTNTPIGGVLFSAQRTRLDPATLTFMAPDFLTGGIAVTPGATYIALLSGPQFAAPDPCLEPVPPIPNCLSLMSIIGGSTDTYAGGHVVVPNPLQMLPAPAPLVNQADVLLAVSFAPEPASWMLIATGMMALAGFRAKRWSSRRAWRRGAPS
jgi:hypothetical protein